MTLSSIACENPFWPALLDPERLTFKNNCVKSNKDRSMIPATLM